MWFYENAMKNSNLKYMNTCKNRGEKREFSHAFHNLDITYTVNGIPNGKLFSRSLDSCMRMWLLSIAFFICDRARS